MWEAVWRSAARVLKALHKAFSSVMSSVVAI